MTSDFGNIGRDSCKTKRPLFPSRVANCAVNSDSASDVHNSQSSAAEKTNKQFCEFLHIVVAFEPITSFSFEY